jgi:hypothetical protein
VGGRILAAFLVVATATTVAVAAPYLDVVNARSEAAEGWLWGELRVDIEAQGPWELLDGPHAVQGAEPPVWELTLVPMKVGEQAVPPIQATVRSTDGSVSAAKVEEPPVVTIASVLASDDGLEPAPLRGPIGVHGFPWEWVLPVFVGTLPLMLVVGALGWRRRGAVEASAPLLPPLAELEAAMRSLAGSIGREPAEQVCDRLASALRRYLERTSGEPAQEMTSFELRLLARRLGWPDSVQSGLQQAMKVADGVRFGRQAASEGALHEAVTQVGVIARQLEEHLHPPIVAGEAAS